MTINISESARLKLTDIVATALLVPHEKVRLDAPLAASGDFDSLSFEIIIVAIEQELGYEIDPIQLLDISTLNDLAPLLEAAGARD